MGLPKGSEVSQYGPAGEGGGPATHSMWRDEVLWRTGGYIQGHTREWKPQPHSNI